MVALDFVEAPFAALGDRPLAVLRAQREQVRDKRVAQLAALHDRSVVFAIALLMVHPIVVRAVDCVVCEIGVQVG